MKTQTHKQVWNAFLGNLFEHYDTALFSFLSPFLAPLLFPKNDPITALILTYAIIPISMLARPFGSLVFGYIGDRYGREHSLFLTLAGMAIISGGMAFIPTYQQIGILAPLLLCFGRALQNFLSAGETMGGAIYVLEKVPSKYHDLISSLYSSFAIGGHLLASLGVYLICQYTTIHLGWRLLYLFGCITALFGCLIRGTSSHRSTLEKKVQTLKEMCVDFWSNRSALLIIILSAGFARATYSIALVLMNGFIPLISSISKAEMMKINTYLLILDCSLLPVFGWLASKISREKLMLLICVGTAVLAIPLFASLKEASLFHIIGVRVAIVLIGVAFFAPFHAWAQQLVPESNRYAVISLGYAIGSQLLGSPTAAFSLWCFQNTGYISSISWYWVLLAIASSVALMMSVKVKSKQLI